jgi:hypothetical protein
MSQMGQFLPRPAMTCAAERLPTADTMTTDWGGRNGPTADIAGPSDQLRSAELNCRDETKDKVGASNN